jgi:hypothetical protein
MAINIVEFFGYAPIDPSQPASRARNERLCPFVEGSCSKLLGGGERSGACTVQPVTSGPVICCPNRLYADHFEILQDVAACAFGKGVPLAPAGLEERRGRARERVLVFGKRWGKELRLPRRRGRGAYFVDWVLALVDAAGELRQFVAVEVQSMDTTGNYRDERDAYLRGVQFEGRSPAGINWENVNKRILPQIIYKGHVLRREPLCAKGMFFVTSTPTYERVRERLGQDLQEYHFHAGALTFQWYDVGPEVPPGHIRDLQLEGRFTTTVDQVAQAFVAPQNLPPARVYEEAIRREMR